MFGTFIVGMWLILTLGKAARAPDDMSGRWSVAWDGDAPNGADDTMFIQQSGRYWVVQLGQQKPMSMLLEHGWTGARHGPKLRMRLKGQIWTIDLAADVPLKQPAPVAEVRMQLAGPSHHSAVARRIVETHADAHDSPTTQPTETAHAR
jgi:hypothetical protein